MQKSYWLGIALLTIIMLLAPTTANAGGWAVVTLIELPTTVPVGEPVALEFVVRQHGLPDSLLTGLSPVIRATQKGQVVTTEAWAGERPGHYHASLVLPAAGTWEWTLEAFAMPVEMPPLTVYEPLPPALRLVIENLIRLFGIDPATVSPTYTTRPVERGRDLFVAKGCATCHRHDSVDPSLVTEVGPDLSDYDADPEFVQAWLQNAATFTSERQWPMPTLELNDEEIEALIAFLAFKPS